MPDGERRAVPAAPLTVQSTEAASDVADLTASILALSPGIDPEEAARAARISYEHTARLRREYQITDGPLLHNIKVNNGTKPRGLCWHWAEDMEKRLKIENFQTLDLHRAIANYDNWRLEHSTTIVSAKGASMYDGIVLDPWRKGGVLTWKAVRADTRYKWTPRADVFEWKRERGLLTTRYVTAAGG
ncbi:hypothetical protein [Roseovarius sp. 2305UL8-3]|uniref:hypothetical protein n=1 Tax=Roseovarius conchicola TaxID=3121636 RepID=UPI003527BB0A